MNKLYIFVLLLVLIGCVPEQRQTPEYLMKVGGCYGFAVDINTVVTAAHCTNVTTGVTIYNQIVTLTPAYIDYTNDIAIYKSDSTILLNEFGELYSGTLKYGVYYGGCDLYVGGVGRMSVYIDQEKDVKWTNKNITVKRMTVYSLMNLRQNTYPVFCSGDSGGLLIIENKIVAMGSLIYGDDTSDMYVEAAYIFVVPAEKIAEAILIYRELE